VLKIHDVSVVAIKYSITKPIFSKESKYSRIPFNIP
jgi:hypothetical protein